MSWLLLTLILSMHGSTMKRKFIACEVNNTLRRTEFKIGGAR